MKSSLKRRLLKIREELASYKRAGLIEVFFIPNGCQDLLTFKAQCAADARKNRTPLFIEFVGPEGGPELGTGPLQAEDLEHPSQPPEHDNR